MVGMAPLQSEGEQLLVYLFYVRVKRFFLVPYWLIRAALFKPKSKSAMIDAENYRINRENPLDF